jgi:hypothetical protein
MPLLLLKEYCAASKIAPHIAFRWDKLLTNK